MNNKEEEIEAYYAIATNDSNRVTNHFPKGKAYAEGWYRCITNQSFIEANDIEIVSEIELKEFV